MASDGVRGKVDLEPEEWLSDGAKAGPEQRLADRGPHEQ